VLPSLGRDPPLGELIRRSRASHSGGLDTHMRVCHGRFKGNHSERIVTTESNRHRGRSDRLYGNRMAPQSESPSQIGCRSKTNLV
jgi:hypothetical protein